MSWITRASQAELMTGVVGGWASSASRCPFGARATIVPRELHRRRVYAGCIGSAAMRVSKQSITVLTSSSMLCPWSSYAMRTCAPSSTIVCGGCP